MGAMAVMRQMTKRGFLLAVLLVLATAPIFSQSITIDKAKLEQIISEEVNKRISAAVDEAVAAAVKAEREKYIDQLAAKDQIIADLNLKIDQLTIQNNFITIQKDNIQIAFNDYKKTHGLGRDLIIGGLSFLGGVVGDRVYFLFTLK